MVLWALSGYREWSYRLASPELLPTTRRVVSLIRSTEFRLVELPVCRGKKTMPGKKSTSSKTAKGEQTKALILNTALEMLHERGYEATTMRAIAKKAGVLLGNAYHYFGSKEHLIQEFYHSTHEDHLRASLPALQTESSMRARLLSVMRRKIKTLEPYHEFAGVLFQIPPPFTVLLNPFADASAPVRRESMKLFEQLVEQ